MGNGSTHLDLNRQPVSSHQVRCENALPPVYVDLVDFPATFWATAVLELDKSLQPWLVEVNGFQSREVLRRYQPRHALGLVLDCRVVWLRAIDGMVVRVAHRLPVVRPGERNEGLA